MTETTHYNLKKPEGSDYAKVETLNQNADAIDAALDGLAKGKSPAGHTHTAQQVGADPAGSAGLVDTKLGAHTAKTDNPHRVTAQQVGADPAGSAGAVDIKLTSHVADGVKHISAAERTAWNAKETPAGAQAKADAAREAAKAASRPVTWNPTWSDVGGKPSTFPPGGHAASHRTGGADALTAGDVGARPSSWNPAWNDVSGKPSTFLPSSHTHTATDVTSGQILTARVGLAYGTCATAAAITAKTVSAANFVLAQGARVAVTFTNAVPTNATLNVNGTGAKYIRLKGSNILGGVLGAGVTAEFVCTGTYWYLLAVDKVSYAIDFADAGWGTIDSIAQAGDAKKFWNIGDQKQVLLTNGETITVRIEDFDRDDLVSGGKAPITFGFKNCLKTTQMMNPSGGSQGGGWRESQMRGWMGTLLTQLPSDLRAIVKLVHKKTQAGNLSSSIQTTDDKLWLFSYTEVALPNNSNFSPGDNLEGTAYSLFVDNASRVKTINGSAGDWFLRSPYLDNWSKYCAVGEGGYATSDSASLPCGVAAGFCI